MTGKLARLLFIPLIFIANSAIAESSVKSPFVNKGEMGIHVNTEFLDQPDDGLLEDSKGITTELEYGFTDRLEAGFDFTAGDSGSDKMEYQMTGFQSTFQFTEQDDGNPVSTAVRAQYKVSHTAADQLSGMVIFGRQGDKFGYVLNVGIKSEVGSSANESVSGDIRASMNYLFRDSFRPGLEYYSDTGELDQLNDINDQQSRLGPVIYGNITPNLSYQAGYLLGLSDKGPDGVYKLNLEYKVKLNDNAAANTQPVNQQSGYIPQIDFLK